MVVVSQHIHFSNHFYAVMLVVGAHATLKSPLILFFYRFVYDLERDIVVVTVLNAVENSAVAVIQCAGGAKVEAAAVGVELMRSTVIDIY